MLKIDVAKHREIHLNDEVAQKKDEELYDEPKLDIWEIKQIHTGH